MVNRLCYGSSALALVIVLVVECDELGVVNVVDRGQESKVGGQGPTPPKFGTHGKINGVT